MKIRLFIQFIGLLLLLGQTTLQAAGLMTPTDNSLPPLKIRIHQVNVILQDRYAITTVEQVFYNPHDRDLEAFYSFPVPNKGAVAEFTYWIDGHPVVGEVLEKQQARQIYAEEKAAGREAGIAEQDHYKTFDIRVWPVRAGQVVRVKLVYLQPTFEDTGIGRYVYPLEEGGVDEQKLNFWTANEQVDEQFSFNWQLRSAYPVEAVRVPNHADAQVTQLSQGEWQVKLHNTAILMGSSSQATQPVGTQLTANPAVSQLAAEANTAAFTLDKDIIVYWRLAANLPGSVDLIAYKPDAQQRGTFMLVVTPGDDLQPITEGRDWIFVLDISGSMSSKYTTLADGIERALGQMHPTDRFYIVLFNNKSHSMTNGFVPATPDNVRNYAQQVAQIRPNEGTNLYAGLKRGLNSLAADRTAAIVLVTDGVANVGETQQKKFLALLDQYDVRLFTFILGNSANRPLLEVLTKASNGFALNISNSDDIVGQLLLATSKVNHQALHGVKLKIDGVRVSDLTPDRIGSLYRGQQLVMLGRYRAGGQARVRLTGKRSGQHKVYTTTFHFPEVATDNPELERLWAYAKIRDIMDEMADFGEEADLKQAVIDLGIEYGLVTDYTAMVVMREQIFAQRGIERRNQQRLDTEHAAQQQRSQAAPQSRRVDEQQPMYSNHRPSFTGGGAGSLDAVSLLMLIPLLLGWRVFRN